MSGGVTGPLGAPDFLCPPVGTAETAVAHMMPDFTEHRVGQERAAPIDCDSLSRRLLVSLAPAACAGDRTGVSDVAARTARGLQGSRSPGTDAGLLETCGTGGRA